MLGTVMASDALRRRLYEGRRHHHLTPSFTRSMSESVTICPPGGTTDMKSANRDRFGHLTFAHAGVPTANHTRRADGRR